MRIKLLYKKSLTKKLFDVLFVDGSLEVFNGSLVLRLLNRFSIPALSIGMFFAGIICFWYEGLFIDLGLSIFAKLNFGTVFLFLSLLFCDKSRIKSSKANIWLLVFIVISLLSSIFAAVTGIGREILISGLALYFQFAVAFIVSTTFTNRKMVVDTFLILIFPILLTGIYQGIFGDNTSRLWVSITEDLISKRAFGFFGSPNILGSVSMISLIMAITTWFDRKKAQYILFSMASFFAMILSYSRSAWIAAAAGIIVVVLVKNWRYVFFCLFGLVGLLIPSLRQRFLTIFSQSYLNDAALDGRSWALKNALSIYQKQPMFGSGPGTYGGQTAIEYSSPTYLLGYQNGYTALAYTDNQWLQVVVQTGIMGVASLLGFYASVFVNNLKNYRRTQACVNLMTTALCVAIIVNGFFANIMEFGAVSVFMAAGLALGEGHEG